MSAISEVDNNERWGMPVEGEAEPAETADAFLEGLGKTLMSKEGVDAGLVDILNTHILKASPTQNAVAQAKDAILKLAGQRANPPKSVVVDG